MVGQGRRSMGGEGHGVQGWWGQWSGWVESQG